MAVANVKDIVPEVAVKLGVSKSEAERVTKAVLSTISESIVEKGGFCYKGQYTIKVVDKKERTGSIVRKDSVSGEKVKMEYTTPAYKSIKATIGAELREELNK